MNFDDPHAPGDCYITTDDAPIDWAWLIATIRGTYFGNWRSEEVIRKSVANSLCFGLYRHGDDKDQQIGFARVVTDYATFAWLADVVVDAGSRGQKLGAFLIRTVLTHPDVYPRAIYLSTRDAHDFYVQFGFERLENSQMMRRVPTAKNLNL